MRRVRILGIAIIALAFSLTALAGLWLALRLSANEIESTRLLAFVGISFGLLLPLFIFGTYLYVRGSQDAPQLGLTELEQQRALIDLIRIHRTLSFEDAAQELNLTIPQVRDLLNDLIMLDILRGDVDWDAGVLYAEDPLLPDA